MATKKQHFVPRFYLMGFSSGGKAWALRKGSNDDHAKPFRASVGDLCSRRYYHEVKVSRAGSPGDLATRGRIESLLSKQEHDLTEPLRDVTSARNVRALKAATAKDLSSMKTLLAHMIIRNPLYLDQSRKESEEFSEELVAKGLFSHEELPLFDGIGLTPRELTEHSIMRAVLWSLEEGSPMHSVLSWLDNAGALVLRAKVGAQFITSDVPFALCWNDAKSDLPTFIYFPLDWRTAVIFHTLGKELASRYANSEEVGFWNRVLARSSKDAHTVIAKSERVLLLAVDE